MRPRRIPGRLRLPSRPFSVASRDDLWKTFKFKRAMNYGQVAVVVVVAWRKRTKKRTGEWRWVAYIVQNLRPLREACLGGRWAAGGFLGLRGSVLDTSLNGYAILGNFLWFRERKASEGNPDFPCAITDGPTLRFAMFSRLYFMTDRPYSPAKNFGGLCIVFLLTIHTEYRIPIA